MIFIICIIVFIVLLVLFFNLKAKLWDEPQFQLNVLNSSIKKLNEDKVELKKAHKEEIIKLQEIHKSEIEELKRFLHNSIDDNNYAVSFLDREFADLLTKYALKELVELCNSEYSFLGLFGLRDYYYSNDSKEKIIANRFSLAIENEYKYRLIVSIYPELDNILKNSKTKLEAENLSIDISVADFIFSIVPLIENNSDLIREIVLLKNRNKFLEKSASNLSAIPYMAQIMADYETYGLEHLAKELDWGYNQQRLKKVKSIREIRNDAMAMVEKNKEAQYQLAYLIEMFPSLQDVIDCEFSQLPVINVEELSEYDATKNYLTKEEYQELSVTERNQLALDRYKMSHNKSKWQIGRDYENYIGYRFTRMGYDVDYFGSYMGLEDLGRDLICKKGNQTLIIQCKYWSKNKKIHEKHITQLYGTVASYCIENHVENSINVKGVLITNIELSDMAKKMSEFLGIKYSENVAMGDYPCIKCNIGRDEFGPTKIYHLPFDQKYDATKIKDKDEFFAMTVEEAEKAGFRRAFKWFCSS